MSPSSLLEEIYAEDSSGEENGTSRAACNVNNLSRRILVSSAGPRLAESKYVTITFVTDRRLMH